MTHAAQTQHSLTEGGDRVKNKLVYKCNSPTLNQQLNLSPPPQFS